MTPQQADARITEWVAEKIRREQMNHITTTHRVIAAESATEVGQFQEDPDTPPAWLAIGLILMAAILVSAAGVTVLYLNESAAKLVASCK